ncbi:hypothetical protein [Hymenobacter weizhouensis]|uniref:hypothetical protein n=1 Tax=Hymenobacter sp. YIM 151500-1 TaxID=2987689 RepID=UPI002227C48D|nr:hypothetical protein [Hymenobacter sp. YIM 151500-1]UYZ62843.1 hypothetical protein OIS53_17825 [Hymenobacter sp. YIM 151500-1]
MLLLLGQVLRLVVTYYEYRRLGAEAISAVQLAMQLLLLLAAMLLLRYGWHERRGGGAAK